MITTKPTGVDPVVLQQRLARSDVPAYLHTGLVQYLVDRCPTGSFLCAVLENDLLHACAYADPESRLALADLVLFLIDYAPATAWGSPARVRAWLGEAPDTS
jgi:hypothetical protein